MESKLVANFGTWSAEDKDILGNVPTATQTLSWPEQIEYEENNEDKPVMWSDALESIIQDGGIEEETWRAIAWVPNSTNANKVKEQVTAIDPSNWDIN